MSTFTFVNGVIESWKSPWIVHQPLMDRIRKNHPVLFVHSEPTFDAVMAHLKKSALPQSGVEKMAENLYEMVPSKFFPRFFFSKNLNNFSTRMRGREIQRFLDKKNWKNRVLYLWHPRFHPLIGRTGESLSVFHCQDYFPAFYPEGTEERIEADRDFIEVCRKADVLIGCSEAILEKMRAVKTERVFQVENGVNFQMIQDWLQAHPSAPEDLQGIKGPIIAHVGRINRKIDFASLEDIAVQRPHWSVGLIGPLTGWEDKYEQRFRKFLSLPNTFHLPGANYPDLSGYLGAIDVGLMAYELGGTWMKYGCPLKAKEYLCAGTPAVAADVPYVRQFAPHVRFVSETAQWIPKIEEALADNSPEAKAGRIDMARRHSWEAKAEKVVSIVEEVLSGKA